MEVIGKKEIQTTKLKKNIKSYQVPKKYYDTQKKRYIKKQNERTFLDIDDLNTLRKLNYSE